VDGANCRYRLQTRPCAFTQTISFGASFARVAAPINSYPQRELLDSAGAATMDWRSRHIHGIPVMSGGRQFHGSDATAAAFDTDSVTRQRIAALPN
jgi:hypothetical protein